MRLGSCQELYISYWCKVGQPDALQHNGMTNSGKEMCMWKLGVLLRDLEAVFLEDEKSTTLRG